MNIKWSDEVLEIGPGAYPFWRSDCLADIFDETSQVDLNQFGGAKLNTKGKPLFKIIDGKLPFKDKSFDYIICSHVFEHVPTNDLDLLSSEIMRVAHRAYIEFPRLMYDYIYNFEVHLNLMDIVNGQIICISKEKTNLDVLKCIQDYSFLLRNRNLFSVESYYPAIMAVGLEFHESIPLRILDSELDFLNLIANNNYYNQIPNYFWRLRNKINAKRFKRIIFGERNPEYFHNKLL